MYEAISMVEMSYFVWMFMEHILLKFGLCTIVVYDTINGFRSTLGKICKALKIKFHVIVKRYHKTTGIKNSTDAKIIPRIY